MSTTGWIVLIVIILILIAMIVGIVLLYKRAKKNQEAQEVAMEANKQTLSMLIIDNFTDTQVDAFDQDPDC